MRADRLLAILLILQRGARVTAGDLARKLEVSERTIYRDLEALGNAGVPVHSEPGRNGGVKLLEGYRTDLSGLSVAEAELVPLLGLSDVLASLGVGPSLRRTEAKVIAAMPEDQRKRAEQSRRRIYVDLSRFWDHAEAVPHLPTIVESLFAGRRVRIDYRRGGEQQVVRRVLDPFGLVVQGGVWYLVARARKREVRTYRVSRIQSAEATGQHHDVPDDFDLASFWATRKEEFQMTREGYKTVLRVRPSVLRSIAGRHHGDTLVVRSEDPETGWIDIDFLFENRWAAIESVLGLGPRAEAIEPDELRAAVIRSVRETAAVYQRALSLGPRSR